MREVHGDYLEARADIYCVTTNGMRNWRGHAVMGAGIALLAKTAAPDLPARIGALIGRAGNHVHDVGVSAGRRWMTFPTKEHWKAPSPLWLIERSARELSALIDTLYPNHRPIVLLPRPGCANGGLDWKVVQPLLAPLLDHRFHILGAQHDLEDSDRAGPGR